MAGTTLEQVKALLFDLKGSWYFRIWALLWVVCAITVFAGLIILGHRSEQAKREDAWQFWFENATQVQFPGFHLRLHNHDEQLVQYTCTYLGNPLPIKACNYSFNGTACFAIDTTGVIVKNLWHEPWGHREIDCKVFTSGGNSTFDNMYVSWELDPPTHEFVPFSTTLIRPNNAAAVNLEKMAFTPKHNNPLGRGETFHFWRRDVEYFSTVHNSSYYHVSTNIRHFMVQHFTQMDAYDGWMAMGDIGGFAFFLIILQSIVMLLVGIFLTNDSKFLTGGFIGGYESAPLRS